MYDIGTGIKPREALMDTGPKDKENLCLGDGHRKDWNSK